MESQRLLHPVFREFYREREAVLEEYRQRVQGNPQGRLAAELLSDAFRAHPYGQPSGGWPATLRISAAPTPKPFSTVITCPATSPSP